MKQGKSALEVLLTIIYLQSELRIIEFLNMIVRMGGMTKKHNWCLCELYSFE